MAAVDYRLRSREELVGGLNILGGIDLDARGAADRVDRAAGVVLHPVNKAVVVNCAALDGNHRVRLHCVCSQINMVVALKHKVNAEVRQQSAELASHADDFLIVIVRAVGVKSLVKDDDLPLCVAALDIGGEPCQLSVAELVVNDIVCVEHGEVNAVIII